jgi:hypothetical protein
MSSVLRYLTTPWSTFAGVDLRHEPWLVVVTDMTNGGSSPRGILRRGLLLLRYKARFTTFPLSAQN